MSQQGIDLRRSGWTNPEGFQPERKHTAPAPPVPDVCGDQGPDGWVCDLPPEHKPAEKHWADTGEPGGKHWTRTMLDAGTHGYPGVKIQGEISEVSSGPMDEIQAIARKALASQSPASWAVALDKIVEVASR